MGPAVSANPYPGLARSMRRFSDLDNNTREGPAASTNRYPGLSEACDDFLDLDTLGRDPRPRQFDTPACPKHATNF